MIDATPLHQEIVKVLERSYPADQKKGTRAGLSLALFGVKSTEKVNPCPP